MGCGHGCGPVHCWPAPRGWYGPVDEYDWYEEERPMRRRARPRSGDRELSTASLEDRLDELGAELRRMEAALAELGRPVEVTAPEK